MKKIIVATHNPGKIREIKEILKDKTWEVLSKKDVGIEFDPEENGDTLEENAYIKCKAIYDQVKMNTLGDDTGLFVKALAGRPGVFSARYAGEKAGDEDNRRKLLEDLKGEKDRRAYFETVICLMDEMGNHFFAKGRCNGIITHEELGRNGFGYDCIFMPDGFKKTFAQMEDFEKNKISHRSKALFNIKEIIGEI